jgi:phytoene dehydrogenase-like protein
MDNTLPATITLQTSLELVSQLGIALDQYHFHVASPSSSYVFSFSETDVEVTNLNGERITEWEELAEHLGKISASTPVSHIRVLENGVQVTMARRWNLNNYQSHRRDRNVGSLVTSLNPNSLHGTFEESKNS